MSDIVSPSLGIERIAMNTTAPFRSILFPTDFSKSSEAIISHAVGLAKATNTKVWILSVVPRLEDWHGASEMYFGPFSDSAVAAFEKERKVLEAERLKILHRFREIHFPSVDTDILVSSGGVAEQIIDIAKEKDIGLIMMPTHALGRRRQFLIGSTTAKVLHDAPCPIWTSPHPRELDPFRSYRRIVLAIDYRSLSGPLLARASEFADCFGASLSVFSAIPTAPEADHQLVQKLKRDLESTLASHLSQCKVKASIHLLEGNPGDVIWEVAEDLEKADLIITGRGRLDEAAGHVQSHNYEIIWNAPCPVITL
jgi:nucleotide-binding universal stress UspA family protein